MPILSTFADGSTFGWRSRMSRRPWYSDGVNPRHNVVPHGSVTQGDEGGGVKTAVFGAGGYLTTALNDDLGNGDFTIEAFIKTDNFNRNIYLIDSAPEFNTQWSIGWALNGSEDGHLIFYNNGKNLNITAAVPVQNAAWNHVAVVRLDGYIRFYINGSLAATQEETSDYNGNGLLKIGRKYEDNYAQGFINGSLVGLRIVKGIAVYTSNFIPKKLPTAIIGTKLLLNFGATKTPTVYIQDDVFTDSYVDADYNVHPYTYTTHSGKFCMNGGPYTGTHAWTEYSVERDAYGQPTGNVTSNNRTILFVVGVEVNGSTVPTVTYTNGVYTVAGNVSIASRGLTSMPNFEDVVVTGNFDCSSNGITSLERSPISVGGTFDCHSTNISSLLNCPNSFTSLNASNCNSLISLNGCPSNVPQDFNISSCGNLGISGTSLLHAPTTVGRDLNISGCNLTGLEHAPTSVGGYFDCSHNRLASLQYAPTSVSSYFDCSYNTQLTSLHYAPTSVDGYFNCGFTHITSLQYSPSSVGSHFLCFNTLITSLQYSPASVGGAFNCQGNSLTSLNYAPHFVGGAFYSSSSNNSFTYPTIAIDNFETPTYWEYTANSRKVATYHHYVRSVGTTSYYMDVAALEIGATLYIASDSNTPVSGPSVIPFPTNTITVDENGVITAIDPLWYTDLSSYARVITNNNKVRFLQEGGGVNAAGFVGGNAYLQTASNIPIGTGNFTIELFLKQFNDGNGGTLVANNAFTFRHDATQYSFIYTVGGTAIQQEYPLTEDWCHIALVRKNQTLQMYVNGVSIHSEYSAADLGSYPFKIGSNGANNELHGKIAGLRVTNTAVYDGSFEVPTILPTDISGTLLLLNFGATAAPAVITTSWYADSSANAYAVNRIGNASLTDEGAGVKAATFNGGYLSTDPSVFDFRNVSGDIAVEYFIKETESSDGTYLGNNLWYHHDSNYRGNLLEQGDGRGELFLSPTNLFKLGYWIHVRVVRSSGVSKMFINGVKVTERSGVSWANAEGITATASTIGNTLSQSTTFKGKIACLRVVVGSDLNSGNGFNVPTTIPTAVTGTKLLLNFNATTPPTVTPDNWYTDTAVVYGGGNTYNIPTNNTVYPTYDPTAGAIVVEHNSSGALTVYNDTAFDFGHNDFTIEYFSKIRSFANGIDGAEMSSGMDTGLANSPRIRINYSGGHHPAFVVGDEEIGPPYYSDYVGNDNVYVQFNVWHHIAVTRQNNTFRMFIDGALIGQKDMNFTFNDELLHKMIFGGNDNYNQYTNGQVACIRVVKGRALYTADFPVPTTVPTAVEGTSLLLTFGATTVPSVG